MATFWIYLIETEIKNHWYVGMTGNIVERISAHVGTRGAKFVQRRGIKRIYIKEIYSNKDAAKKAEKLWTIKLNKEGKFCAGGGYSSDEHVRILRHNLGLPNLS